MKDLDFDELDRAVSTLMGNVTTSAEPAKQDDTKTLTITSTLTDDKPPVLPVGEAKVAPRTPADTGAPVSVNVSRPLTGSRPTPLATRRTGRFMDMVAPAAATRKTTLSQGVSRQGVSVAPVSDTSDTPTTPTPVSSDIIDTSTAGISARDANEWPDPLDFEQSSLQSIEAPTAAESTSDERNDSVEPLTSPFLADAKVEKRPLGAPASEVAVAPQPNSEAEAIAEEPVERTVDTGNQPPAAPLPEELQGDVMAIESDSPDVPDTLAESQDTPAPEDASIEETTVKAPKAEAAAPTPAAPTLMGSGSIPQQYREEPSTSDQTTGSIYDTASYHQPLEHPAQKKTGWLWVLWVVILLILGAGGGALAYLYLLQ